MTTMNLALESGGPKRLELSWGLSWKNFRVTLDGKLVGTVEGGQDELKTGVEFRLPDGSALNIRLNKGLMNVALEVLRDGQPLPGSSSDPEQRVRSAAHLLYFLAGLNTVLGVLALALDSEFLQNIGMGIGSILFGAIVATLGFFTYRGSRVAPGLAIVLYVGDFLFTFFATASEGGRPQVGGIFVRIVIIHALWKAVEAAGELSRRREGVMPQGA
jgi:hypothetical protein